MKETTKLKCTFFSLLIQISSLFFCIRALIHLLFSCVDVNNYCVWILQVRDKHSTLSQL